MRPNKKPLAQLQKELEQVERMLGFHNWLLERFEASTYADDVKTSMIKRQKVVIESFETDKTTLEGEIRQQTR